MIDWSRLDAALERGQATFWWRDDDAVTDSRALERLMALAEAVRAPLMLAVIPGKLTPSLAPAIAGRNVTVAVHGWTHRSHAPPGEKNAEFGSHRPTETMLAAARRGKAVIDAAFGDQALPVFVPPWNRLSPELPLAEAGFEGVSIYDRRRISRARGLLRFDAHLDPIDWRGSRSAVASQGFVNRIASLLETDEPVGLMTHHLVHDEAIWSLVEAIVRRIVEGGGRWISAREILASRHP